MIVGFPFNFDYLIVLIFNISVYDCGGVFMESIFGNSSLKGLQMSSSGNDSPLSAFIEKNRYYHSPMSPIFNPYASSDGTSSDNSDSAFFRYLRSASSSSADPVDDNQMYLSMIGNQFRGSNSSSSGSLGSRGSLARSPFSPIENMESPPLGSQSVLTAPVNLEEDVLVMDGILVPSVPGSRRRCLSSSDSGDSSSPGSNSIKKELCRSSKCQFAYGKENQRPKRLPNKSKTEAQLCKTNTGPGSCSYGSKYRFLHHELSTTASPSATITTNRTISPLKLEHPTTTSIITSITDWPLKDLSAALSRSETLKPLQDFTTAVSPSTTLKPLQDLTTAAASPSTALKLLQDLTTASSSSAILTTTPMISAITLEHSSSSSVITANPNWSPLDDGLKVTLPSSSSADNPSSREEVDAYINNLLYGPTGRKRLAVFIEICSE